MKKLFTTVLGFIIALSVWAEAPQTISYQAVVRNNVGRLLREHPVGVRISILSGSENGQVVYSETRTTTTNNNGLLTFAIGDANGVTTDDLSKIAWADNTYYLRCEMDPDGGNSYTLSSTSQMNSVPYALYAKNIAPEALPSWAQSEEKPVYNYTEIQGAPSVPTKVSELQNDANYITLQQVPTVVVPTKVSELQNDANYLTEHQSLADYAKKSDLPAVPTKVSAFENDANYLTEHQSLADYAKKSELPIVPTKVSELTNDANYITLADVPAIPTKVSAFENDAQYITKTTFDGVIEGYNALLDKYKKQLDSLMSVMTSVSASNVLRLVVVEKGALPGEFSVSADKKVKFSMGNLQYQAKTGIWRFAANQYDYVGSSNAEIAKDYSGWIDLFGWGTSGWESGAMAYQPYSTSTLNSDYYPGNSSTTNLTGKYVNADWGANNAISNGGNRKGQWRVLTSVEWNFLYSGRENAAGLRTKATVEGVHGYVFFPDGWVQTDVVPVELDASDYSINNFSALRWNVLESHGAVFLPAAGRRYNTTISHVGSGGHYWSSSSSGSKYAYSFYFYIDSVYVSDDGNRNYGRSVRLVQE